VRFELVDDDLRLYAPDGKKFATYVELAERADKLASQSTAWCIEPEA